MRLGTVASDFSNLYANPRNVYTGATVTLLEPVPGTQCNITVASNEKARRAVRFLPERTDINLIALSFYCSVESRREYFPLNRN